MTKNELKKTLKPLIKESIREMLFEEGFLSSIIKETISGMKEELLVESSQPVTRAAKKHDPIKPFKEHVKPSLREEPVKHKKTLEETSKRRFGGVNIFEGVQPIGDGGPGSYSESAPPSPFSESGISPNDPGLDLSLLGIKI